MMKAYKVVMPKFEINECNKSAATILGYDCQKVVTHEDSGWTLRFGKDKDTWIEINLPKYMYMVVSKYPERVGKYAILESTLRMFLVGVHKQLLPNTYDTAGEAAIIRQRYVNASIGSNYSLVKFIDEKLAEDLYEKSK